MRSSEVARGRGLLPVLWCAMVATVVAWMLIIPYTPRYLAELGVQGQADLALYTGLAAGATALGTVVGAFVWGFASDRWARRRVFLLAILAGVGSYALYALVRDPVVLVLARFLIGMNGATMMTASAVVLAETRVPRVASALGVLTSAVFVGNGVGPPLGGVIVGAWGAHAGILGSVLCQLAALTVAVVGFRRTAPPHVHTAPVPTSTGTGRGGRLPGVVAAVIGLLLVNAVTGIYQTFLPVGLLLVHPESVWVLTGAALGVYGAMAALGSIGSDRLHQIRGPRVLLAGTALPLVVAFLLMSVVHAVPGVLVLAGVAGTMVGVASPLLLSRAVSWAIGTRPGLAAGVVMVSQSLGGALGALTGGWVAVRSGTFAVFDLAAILSGMLLLVALAIAGRVRRAT